MGKIRVSSMGIIKQHRNCSISLQGRELRLTKIKKE
jgi:hypothetical protein